MFVQITLPSRWMVFATVFVECLISVAVLPSTARAEVSGTAITTLQTAETGSNLDQTALADAWQQVAAAEMADLPDLLSAFDEASPVGVNWLSSAMDQVLERSAAAGISPSIEKLTAYVLDASHGPRGRETALELLREQDPAAADNAIAKLIEDPVARLRRPAVAALIERAKQATGEEQLASYQRAFAAALDEDQVVACVVALRDLGQPVDHIRKFGLLMHWQIIGPFDYQDGAGFDTVYPPESLTLQNYDGPDGIYSESEHAGKEGPVTWKSYVNTARNGEVSLNKAIGELRDAVAYGATIYESDREQQVELRLRQQNSAKLWLNGELVFSQPIGHTGNFFDQYTVPVTLRKGPNLILVKSCQWSGPVYHPFVGTWQFGVRVCDATGNAILATNRPPTPELDPLPNQNAKESSESDDDPTETEDEPTESANDE